MMRASCAAPCRTVSRPRQMIGVALLSVGLIAGCTSGSDHQRASARSSSVAKSAPSTSGHAALAHPAVTPVPPPTRGNIHQKVHAAPVLARPPVPLHSLANVGSGVTATISSIKAIHVQAVGPGEVAGPGVNIVVEVRNDSSRAIDLRHAVVTISDAEGTPGVPMVFAPQPGNQGDDDVPPVSSDSFSRPMTGSLAPRHTVNGTYVFTLPAGRRNPVTVNFSYAGNAPVVTFKGDTA